jgi:ribose-phosphate pyrophosphokinase
MSMVSDGLIVLSGSNNPWFSQELCKYLEVEQGKLISYREPDGEFKIKIDQNVRGGDLFIIQSENPRPNRSFMEMLLIIDAARRSSARRVTAVFPYFSYSIEASSGEPHYPMPASLKAALLEAAGIDRVLAFELHHSGIKGHFSNRVPVDHLHASTQIFVPYIKNHFRQFKDKLVVVSAGKDTSLIKAYAKDHLSDLGAQWHAIDPNDGVSVRTNLDGKVSLYLDDIVNTGTSIERATKYLLDARAEEVHCFAPHMILSAGALEKIEKSPIKSVVTTDTIKYDRNMGDKIHVLSATKLFGEAIRRIHNEDSLGNLY